MKKILLFCLLFISTNTFAQQWTTKAPMPTARSLPGLTVVNNIIYAIGGHNGSGTLTVVEAYDPSTNTWSTKAPMPTSRTSFSTVAVSGKIYVIGGWYGGYALSTVEEYDPSNDTWATKASMPTARSQASAAVMNGIIYVAGGWPNGKTNFEAYNPGTNAWTILTALPLGILCQSSEVLNNKFYMFGGKKDYPGTNVVPYDTTMYYDSLSNSWTIKASMPHKRFEGAVVLLNNEFHYLGGTDNTVWLNPDTPNYNTHDVYNPASDTWTSGLNMIHKRAALNAVTVNGKIYAIGGIDSLNNIVNWNEEYSPGICYAYITVTDTLIINANLTGVTPVTYANTIKIFPNPSNDHITIDYGSNLGSLAGYTLKITNSLSQTVFTTSINQPSSYINLSSWTGKGLYFVYLIDSNTNIIDVRKIVLQ